MPTLLGPGSKQSLGTRRDEEAEFANTEAKEFAQESAAVPTRITGAEVVTPDESH